MTPAAQTSEPQTEAGRALDSAGGWYDEVGTYVRCTDLTSAIRKIESEAQRLTVERLHQYLHGEGVWPDDDEAWHLRVCEGALGRDLRQPTPSPDAATEPSTLRHRLGPPLSVLDEVRAQHHRQDVATPDDEVWTSCAICYMLGEGWPCTVARLVAVCDEQIESEARAASVKGEPASAQAVAPGLDYSATWREFEAYEDRAAKQGSGMSRDQMTGASMMLSWLCNRDKAAAYATTDPDAKEAGGRQEDRPMTPAAQTSEPQTEAGRELVEIAPQLWRQPSNRSMPMEPMQLEIRKAVLAIESEAQRLTVERRIDLTEIAAAMLRGEQACERGHRAGEINAHVHFDQLQRWARRLAALAREETGE